MNEYDIWNVDKDIKFAMKTKNLDYAQAVQYVIAYHLVNIDDNNTEGNKRGFNMEEGMLQEIVRILFDRLPRQEFTNMLNKIRGYKND